MNYLKEVLAFNRAAEADSLTPSERVLWHALMDICNSTGWKKTFNAASITLQSKTGLSKKSILNARNQLAQRGYISLKTRSGKSSEYCLISFENDADEQPTRQHFATLKGTHEGTPKGTHEGTPKGTPKGTIHKLNETKENKTKPLPPSFPPGGFERFWEAYPLKKAKPVALKAFTKLNPDDALLEAMLGAIDSQRMSEQWRRDGGKYIPHPATWLNQRRWEDQGVTPQATVYEEFTGW